MELQQPKDSRYVKNAGAVFNLSYHIVWCPKCRRKVLSEATVKKYIENQKGR
jgi:REP element-mobilizing transposase RayT